MFDALIALSLAPLAVWLFRYRIKPWIESARIKRQWQGRSDWKQLRATEELLTNLYAKVNGTRVSYHDRKRLMLADDAFIYGEIEFLSFFSILEQIKPQPGEVFYDLGCGSGKAVFSAALHFDLSKACGVELLPGLCSLANAQIKQAEKLIHLHPNRFSEIALRKIACIEFINDDFLNTDISAADIVYVNATCLGYCLWEKMVSKLTQLKPGSRVILTTKTIQHEQFSLLSRSMELMSWGMNSVNVYVKD